MKVNIDELQRATERVLRHMRDSGVTEVEVPHDYYWEVPAAARYDPSAEPEQLSIGQLSDDLNELRRMADNETEPLAYALVWLGSVFKAVGETVVQ
jgi:hypothetical protein